MHAWRSFARQLREPPQDVGQGSSAAVDVHLLPAVGTSLPDSCLAAAACAELTIGLAIARSLLNHSLFPTKSHPTGWLFVAGDIIPRLPGRTLWSPVRARRRLRVMQAFSPSQALPTVANRRCDGFLATGMVSALGPVIQSWTAGGSWQAYELKGESRRCCKFWRSPRGDAASAPRGVSQ